MISYKIYVVDDEESIRDAAELTLTEYRLRTFPTAEEALEAVKDDPPDLILLDIGLPGMSGVDALGKFKELVPQVVTIMITAYEDVETVVAAMRQGAYDYVVKPLYMDGLKQKIMKALETVRLRKEVQELQERYLRENMPLFIGESNAVGDMMEFVSQVAQSADAPVLILGETGTGKELIAGAIHYKSPNCRGPLVRMNCAAIPAELLESELFGYESGAFSGARAGGKKGLIEEADGGTLFLDEVGDLSPQAQAKLLRFLDSGEFYKVGGTRPKKVRLRVISATNRDLEEMGQKGTFRRDLYFRLAVLKVEVPSLNHRREDILPIARHFLWELSQKYGKEFRALEKRAEEHLMNRLYQGNVRELKGMLERAVLIGSPPLVHLEDLGDETPCRPAEKSGTRGTQGLGDLPGLGEAGLDLAELLESVEARYLEKSLELCGGNDSKAAQLLGMNYHTFRYRKKKLGLA